MELFIKRVGNAIAITGENDSPLPLKLIADMHSVFRYHVKRQIFIRRKLSFEYEDVYMLVETKDHKLLTSFGLLPSILRWFKENNISFRCFDATDPKYNYLSLMPDESVINNQDYRVGQRECIDAFVQRKHGIIVAPVGFGKTHLISVLIKAYPQAKFHICTKSRDVLQEIYNRLLPVTPSVGIFCGDRKDRDKRVTLITADSLGLLACDDVAFFLYDECHQAAAPTYMNTIIEKYRYSRLYGFSATPRGRSDEADDALTFLFGDVIYNMSYQEGERNGLVVPINVQWLRYVENFGGPKIVSKVAQFRHYIWRNERRNQLIADYIHENIPEDKKVLVLVSKIEHALYLKRVLPEFELVYATLSKEDLEQYKRCGLLPEDYKSLTVKDRKRMQSDFKTGRLKKVIATSVWNTGVDFPDLAYVVNASAGSSVIVTTQGGGRASRVVSGKTEATVIDVVDLIDGCTSSFYRGSLARRKIYTSLGWRQYGWNK